ncbi:GPI mannosyltransferase 4 [Orussus abietinus]|uniref:GPI mannosyltransferase 4 n=1 Tax=Orussus abietinus TaxID=222816 RepID=UPI000625FB99|nr:GPI mannosyltransferase 4 [Orussus abietinus]
MLYKNVYSKPNYQDVKQIKSDMILYWVLAGLRFFLTLLPQRGYIHPDEYFQSIEVVAGDYFDIDVYKPWEFNTTFPVRSAIFPYMTVGISYSILCRLSSISSYIFGSTLRSPYFLIVLPRLLICSLSFITDYCLYKICCIYGQNHRVRLIVYASSYVTLVYATRTFSNSIELILTSLLLYVVSGCMAYSGKVVRRSDYLSERYRKALSIVERVKYYKLRASLPSHSLNHCFLLAAITVTGIFNRPTFIAFAFPPIFFWLHRGLGSKSVGFIDFHVRIFTFVIYCLPIALTLILVDSFYFGYLTIAEIGSLKISMNNFVVTPLNFMKYNLNNKNLEIHGLHPRLLHFIINVPLLFGILGIIGLITFGKMLYSGSRGHWLELPRIQSITGLMTASFIVPIAMLSIFPHQEPRFIVPVILPIIFLYSSKLSESQATDIIHASCENSQRKSAFQSSSIKLGKLQVVWCLSNVILTLFYGFFHQGGVLPLTSHFANELRAKPHLTHVHLYTSYTYSIPTALLQLRNTRKTYMSSAKHKYQLTKDFYLYEEGSKNVVEVQDSIAYKLQECEERFKTMKLPYRLYYAIPATLLAEFAAYNTRNNSQFLNYRVVKTFYPHVTTEKLPLIFNNEFSFLEIANSVSQNTLHGFFNLVDQFGLALLRIETVSTR